VKGKSILMVIVRCSSGRGNGFSDQETQACFGCQRHLKISCQFAALNELVNSVMSNV